MKISYVTGNARKFGNAQKFFAAYDIEVEQLDAKIEELQSDDSLDITIDKAKKAFGLKKKPLFVNDATWIIPALKGFPGPFMKYINQWFEPVDFIHLMQGKDDRRIILRDHIVYIDEAGLQVFTGDHEGFILEEVTPLAYQYPSDAVISLSKNHVSVAETKANGGFFIEDEDVVWRHFAEWLKHKPH